ncbi:Oidioi.mRNA.OKI2018_I69.chr2.g6099.t1.cds [Oikopleura dioica]|uniref:Oidioi.mRNA.OKI2018_I69.chr2.g6099.t1.cds n=1 Tax=Oikopleura dioica TaxID=34765 RepID=A0ABN7T8Y9_OIKDI|nr:Oidioi.mRNA.OKI2018_I69.chr2.g6099.t1.cds [Oikopleura dioica]
MADSEVESSVPQDSISVGDNQSTFTGSTVTGFTSTAARRKIINVETSTLFQLRSEVAQKAGEVTEIKNKIGVFKAPVVSRKLLPEELKAKRKARKEEKRNAGIDARNERDMAQRLKDRETADKVRRKLEAKSRIYDAVNYGEELDDYMRENCLVDFDGKEVESRSRDRDYRRGDPRDLDRDRRPRERHYSHQSETSDLIEHTDALGRTKYISREQLREEREYDREITDMRRGHDYDERSSRYSDGSRSPSPESKQARFQNIDDGDIRDLGVGYYNFSADESTRRQQMSILDTLRASTEDSRQNKQIKETEKAEKKRKMLERKRAKLAKKFKVDAESIAIPETNVVVDLPAPKPMNMTEMNIDRNIAKAKKAERDWDKEKDLDEIYGKDEGHRRPVALETDYYQRMRDERRDEFAPSYDNQPTKNHYTSTYLSQQQQQTYSNQYGGSGYGEGSSQQNQGPWGY